MKNKKILILSIIFIFIMGGAVIGYNYLKNNYNIDLEDESIDKIKSIDFTVYDINNKEVNLSDYKGKNVVINFWASWCPPCKYEMPSIDKIKSIDFTVYDINNKEVNLSDYKGKNVVINFWASWCPPCKYEMPYFQNATEKYKDKNIEILMLNLTDGYRETVDSATKYMKENNFHMNLLFDKNLEAATIYQVQGVPRTIFIDKEGYIIKDYTGAMEQDVLYDEIDKLIK